MTFKTILVHAGEDPVSIARLRAADRLGQRLKSHVIAVGAYGWTPVVDIAVGYSGQPSFDIFVEDVRADVATVKKTFNKLFQGRRQPPEWRGDVAMPDHALLSQAHCADLIVASPRPKDSAPTRVADPARLIMESGLPVLLCPPQVDRIAYETVVVGWKNTRECRRAVSDAVPLLKAAREVVLVAVPELEPLADMRAELEGVVERLSRHGASATFEIARRHDGSIGERLADLVRAKSAQLVVLGAYGHSRLREWAFGGVTSDFMAEPPCPVLFGR